MNDILRKVLKVKLASSNELDAVYVGTDNLEANIISNFMLIKKMLCFFIEFHENQVPKGLTTMHQQPPWLHT